MILPNETDYLIYDDVSHVVDDNNKNEKWCGIKIDSKFLLPFLVFKINGIEYKSQKLKNPLNDEEFEGKLLTDSSTELKTLELVGDLVDSTDLQEMIKKNSLIEKFEAHLGSLTEIASGTFADCNFLTKS